MKHLNDEDRLQIQEGLVQGLNFVQIAERIGKDRSTVSREVKSRRIYQPAERGNFCVHRSSCHFPQDCYTRTCVKRVGCRTTCGLCRLTCSKFEEDICPRLQHPSYVCNGCQERRCKLGKWRYSAKEAQQKYKRVLRESQEGISLCEAEYLFLKEEIMPLIQRGISVSVACDSQLDRMPVSAKTLYSYIDQNIFEIRNLDLRRKVRRPLRKKSGPSLKVDKKCYVGRSYEDFQAFDGSL